jgi:hypothetical protein
LFPPFSKNLPLKKLSGLRKGCMARAGLGWFVGGMHGTATHAISLSFGGKYCAEEWALFMACI